MRRIPADLQPFAGDLKVLRRSLGLITTNQSDPAVIQAWTRAHEEAEALLDQAKSHSAETHRAETKKAEAQGDGTSRWLEHATTPLMPRDIAGIAAEPWRQALRAIESNQASAELRESIQDIRLQLDSLLMQALQGKEQEQIEQGLAQIRRRLLAPVLDSLDLAVDARTNSQLDQRMRGYLGDVRVDVEARAQGDYGTNRLTSKAPPLPEKKISWKQLLDQYLISVGGTTEKDGVGVSEDRILQYKLYIKDIRKVSGKHFPIELTVDDARHYVNSLQTGSLAVGTQQKRLDGVRNLFNVAIQYGLLDVNPFGSMKIKAPRGTEEKSYRAFRKEELKAILDLIRSKGNPDRLWVIEALLCTGARAGEVLKLRHRDICQAEDGVWYLDFKHQPTDVHPTLLKGAQSGERKTPLHPLLVASSCRDYLQRKTEGYIIDMSTDTSSWTMWFRRSVLIPLGIYERKCTGLHSLRNTAIDLWREAGLSGEVRKALVAHANTDVHDRVYGEGLKNMPSVLYKELSKVNLKSYIE